MTSAALPSEPLADTTCSHGRPDHQVLVRQLAEALGLDLPALPATPQSVWFRLLTTVEALRADRDTALGIIARWRRDPARDALTDTELEILALAEAKDR